MDNNTLAQYIGTSVDVVDYIMSMSDETIIRDDTFITLLKSVDRELLEKTLPAARDAYEAGLPIFQQHLKERYGLESAPMSAYTLGNWVVGALQFPDYIDTILNMHDGIAAEVFAGGLPDLLNMVAEVPGASREWQKALCIFSLPLMNA